MLVKGTSNYLTMPGCGLAPSVRDEGSLEAFSSPSLSVEVVEVLAIPVVKGLVSSGVVSGQID